MKETKEKQLFYIEPLDADTNKAIGEFLQQRVDVVSCEEKKCKDGRRRNLWELEVDDFSLVIMSRSSLKLNCNTFWMTIEGIEQFEIVIDENFNPALLREKLDEQIELQEKAASEFKAGIQSVLRPPSAHIVRDTPPKRMHDIRPKHVRK